MNGPYEISHGNFFLKHFNSQPVWLRISLPVFRTNKRNLQILLIASVYDVIRVKHEEQLQHLTIFVGSRKSNLCLPYKNGNLI